MTGHADAPQLPPELDEREQKIWHMYAVQRWTQARIAREMDLSQVRIHQILVNIKKRLPPIDRTAMIQQSADLYQNIISRLEELALMEGAPVTAGKDGDVVHDPVSGNVVRDYSARMNALAQMRQTDAELRKLLGLDAATKVETTGTVRYVLEGVDTDDLA